MVWLSWEECAERGKKVAARPLTRSTRPTAAVIRALRLNSTLESVAVTADRGYQ